MRNILFKLWGTHVLGVPVLVTVIVGMERNELQYGVASDGDALKRLAKLSKVSILHAVAACEGEIAVAAIGKTAAKRNVAARMGFMLSMIM
jgi:hypothetical protein